MFPVPQNCLCSPVPLMFRLLHHYSPEINVLVLLLSKTPGRASSIIVTFHSLLSSPNLTIYYNVAVWNVTFEPRHDKTNKVDAQADPGWHEKKDKKRHRALKPRIIFYIHLYMTSLFLILSFFFISSSVSTYIMY